MFFFLKLFENAIKATREGKAFNYGELTVPPGFAPIPLNNGKPILRAGSAANKQSSSSTLNKPNTSRSNLVVEKSVVTPKEIEDTFDEEAFMRKLQEGNGDDDDDDTDAIIAKLELENDNELNGEDLHDDDDDVEMPQMDMDFGDPELNKKLKSLQANVISAKSNTKKPSLCLYRLID